MAGAPSKKITVKAITEAITITSVIASIAAIVHLYGVGLSAKVNMLAYVGLHDYLRVAIGWIIPSIIPTFMFGYSITSIIDITTKNNKAINVEKFDCSDCNNCFIHKYEINILKIFKISIFILLISLLCNILFIKVFGLFSRESIAFTTLSLILCFISFFSWYISSVKRMVKHDLDNIFPFFFITILLIYSFGSGLSQGSMESKINKTTINKVIIDTDKDSKISGELLFALEKFIVIRETDHSELTFIATDSVILIKTPAIPPSVPIPEITE